MPHQILVAIRAPVKPDRESEVSALLAALRKGVEDDGSPFASMPGVHFARVFVLPLDADLAVPDTLVYLGEIDAPLRVTSVMCRTRPPGRSPRFSRSARATPSAGHSASVC